MLIFVGYLILTVCIFGGYLMAGGYLGPLWQPAEVVIIAGAAVGSFVAANNGKTLKATLSTFKRLRRTNSYSKQRYFEVLTILYKLMVKAKKDGFQAIESDVEEPESSTLFEQYPAVQSDPLIRDFMTDYLRLMVSGNSNPHEFDELMTHEIEEYEHDAAMPAEALQKVGDALPAFGIVAAVMGMVKALSAADASAAELGIMVAHALVGTFLGILMAYGYIIPVAHRLKAQVAEGVKMLQCIRVTLLASLNGTAPQMAVEFGRKALHDAERPSFTELEETIREAKSAGTAS